MGPTAALLPCGTRLHLQHGPIDLVIGADGDRRAAFRAARARFETVLEELVAELTVLRSPARPGPCPLRGGIARDMWRAVQPHAAGFVTPMAAVAGAVADHVLAAMRTATPLTRAYVNNGGDIALFLATGQSFTTAMSDLHRAEIGRVTLTHNDGVGGIATSGAGGRSMSLGIADSVTVLADSAAQADAAATIIANAVDLPGHPGITRRPARDLQPDSDLGDRCVTVACTTLPPADIACALERGLAVANDMCRARLITAAALHLQGDVRLAGRPGPIETIQHRMTAHA